MRTVKSLQGLLGRQDCERAGALTRFSQLQYQKVAANQDVGATEQGHFQEHLVVGVTALGQGWQSGIDGVSGEHRYMGTVGAQQTEAPGIVQSKLFITGHAFQFIERPFVRQTDHAAAFNRPQQRGERWCLEMEEIHHYIGVEHQSGGCRD